MLKKILLLVSVVVLSAVTMLNAQVTTGSITGLVKSQDGELLKSATITAVHEPTGTKYTTTSNSSGAYTLPNLRIGGPYSVIISYSSHQDAKFTDLQVSLGDPLVVDANLSPKSQELAEVLVVSAGNGGIINGQRNGTSTLITTKQLQSLPSINRSVQDFARLSPQVKAGNNVGTGASTGLSFAGQSNRYNQFAIDGANASDAFGLTSSGTNGGQANVNPISMEAIQEIQIVLSPYDVTQGGFTGGGINAITKSGTNQFHGAVYGQFQNENLIGKNNQYNSGINRQKYGDFTNRTFGASFGGPIIKNKLFFYINAERYEKSTPLAYDPTKKGSGSKVNPDTLQKIRDFMLNTYGFDLGSYGAINNDNNSTSLFGRLDWNINDKHKLTFRHNYVDGSDDKRSRAAATPLFENTGYSFATKSNSTVLELNSAFSSSSSNVFRVTYNQIRDKRTTAAAPNLAIYSYSKDSAVTVLYNLGSEYSSAANSLDQDIFSITDNFTLYRGNHSYTFGTSNEFFKSGNVYLQGYYGAYTYGSSGTSSDAFLSNWFNNAPPTQYQIGYSTSGRGDKAVAELKAAQFALYGQDIWKVNKNLRLTYGVRFDLPYVSNTPAANADFNQAFASYGVKTDQMPKKRIMVSPRVGFNWDVNGNATTQLRGGVGLFTGRIPFVWISNQMSTTGVATKSLTYTGNAIATNDIKYTFDKNDPQYGAFMPATTSPSATIINVIDKDFKFPQVLRGNIAVDQKLGWGLIGTIEGVYSKTLNNAAYKNLNISENGDTTVTLGPTTRPYWKAYSNSSFAQVIKLGNTSAGYAFSLTAQIQKIYSHGWAGSIAYTYGTAESYNDIPSSVALSNWRGTQTVNGLNKLDFGRSNFDMGSRINGFISKEFKYGKIFATTITLFYNGQTGQRLSYLYNNVSNRNITGDDISASSGTRTSLVYIPATQAEANFADISGGKTASEQWADFVAFADANPYLKDNMGKNAKRNGDKLPWENHFDMRISQDISYKTHKLQLFVDVLNLNALINKDWGRSYYSNGDDGFYPASVSLFTPVVGAQKQDGTAISPTVYKPAFQFNINNFTKVGNTYRPYTVADFTSRWRAQIGIRYSF
ncbi:MAG: TonB-dependent receptor [Niabella sp.]